jgi:hypothetical protein
MREKVKFTEGQPVVVILDFNDGTECKSRDGSLQYQYVTDSDARIMFVDPPIRNYILSEGAKAGDAVEIVKCGQDPRAWAVTKLTSDGRLAPKLATQPERTQRTQQGQAPAAAQPAQPAAPISSRTVEMVAALIGAIDAAAEAERYAARQGMPLKFDRGDIRAIAATLYIGKDGR